MALESIGLLVGGLALFLYGLLTLSNRVQRLISGPLRKAVYRLTKKPVYGAGVGALFTSLVQSSSATTVLTVGMVNAGIISLYQALGIIFGSEVGTTVTAQLVSFEITAIAPFVVAIGFVLYFISKGKRKILGEAILAFGILFFGISLMGLGLEPLKTNPEVMGFFASIENPIIGILIGAAFTGIIQSSSVTTSLVVMLGQRGMISLVPALGLIIGANIGTCITALIASSVASRNAKRVGLAHLFYNVFGALVFLTILPVFAGFVAATSVDVGRQIANAHTIFNVSLLFVFLLIARPYERFLKKILPAEERQVSYGVKYVDKKIAAPGLGVELVRKELSNASGLVNQMVEDIDKSVRKYDEESLERVRNIEYVIDDICKETSLYLLNLSRESVSSRQREELSAYYNVLHEIERIGDHCVIMADLLEEIKLEKIKFPKQAMNELEELLDLSAKNVEEMHSLLEEFDEKRARGILVRHSSVKRKTAALRSTHFTRLLKGESPYAGTIFEDLLGNLQSESRHASSVAKKLLALKQGKKNANAGKSDDFWIPRTIFNVDKLFPKTGKKT